jgi:LacI family transcriptional regulator
VDGAVVFLSDDASPDVLESIQRQVPVVWAMGGQSGPLPVDHVSESNLAIGYLAHRYLQSCGSRDMAFLTIVPHKRNALQRWQAIAGAAAAARHRFRAFVTSEDSSTTALYGADVVARPALPELVAGFAALSPLPTGLFVDRDSTALRVQAMLIRHGIKPGKDLRIISCDNDESALAGMYPRPATIDLGVAELGRRVVQRLMLRMENCDERPVFIQTMPRLCPGDEHLIESRN